MKLIFLLFFRALGITMIDIGGDGIQHALASM